jgi:hypothetical protein
MSLQVSVSSEQDVVQIGFSVLADYVPSDGGLMRYIVNRRDLILSQIRSGLYFCNSRAGLVSDVFDLDLPNSREILQISTRVTRLGPREVDARLLYYRSIFSTIGSALYILRTQQPPRFPGATGENFVKHFTYSGSAIPRQVSLITGQVQIGYDESNYRLADYTSGQNCWDMSIVSLDPLVISPVISVSSDRHSYDFLSFLSIFTDGPVTYHTLEAGGTQDVFVTVSDFSYTFTGTSISIRYTTDYRGYGDTAHWDSSFYIPFDMQDELLTPVVGHTYHGGTVGYTTFSFSGGSGVITDNPPLGALSDTYTAGFGQRNIKLLLSVPSMFDVSKPTAESVSLYFSKYKSLSSFASAFDLSFRDIVASSMFSSVDAFKKAEGSLNRDVLQDLSKLPDIASAIPDISKAIDIVLSLAKGRPLRSLKDILDFATQLELQKDFQIRPVITLLTEYLPAMLKSINHLGLPSKLITSYGSFTFKLPPGSLGREDVTLVTRTKMVLDGSSSGLLSAALGYDALGLVPKPSNLWDLVPFSFALNWFTGVGKAMDRGEVAVVLTALPAYYVHSYTLTSPLTDLELEELQLVRSTTQPSLRLYCRDVTSFSPTPQNSRFGFGIPQQLPSLATMGSLVWQLLFADS